MGTLGRLWSVVRARLGVAAGMAAAVGCGVLLLALVCATYTYSNHGAASHAAFGEHARRIGQMTALNCGRGPAGIEALRLFFGLEMHRENLDFVGVGSGRRLLVAGDSPAEGLDAEAALGRPGLVEVIKRLTPDATSVVIHNAELGRLESILAFEFVDGQGPGWLYLATDARAIEREAWARFRGVLNIGCILAMGAALLVFMVVQEGFVGPMSRLMRRMGQDDQRRGPLDAHQLGELASLARLLDPPAQRGLRTEQQKQSQIENRLERTGGASSVQLELVLAMVRDLRAAMAAVLAHADIQASGQLQKPQRSEWVKTIQHEARRVQDLGRRILDLLSSATEAQADHRRVPPGELKAVMQELKALRFRLETQAAGAARTRMQAPEQEAPPAAVPEKPEERLVQIKHLRGAVLVVGQAGPMIQGAVRELQDLGLNAVWVEGASAVQHRVPTGGFDAVIVQLTRCDDVAKQTVQSIRACFSKQALVALLPGAARGTGEQVLALGCNDYIYAPVTRGAMLAVIAKYLGFQPAQAKP